MGLEKKSFESVKNKQKNSIKKMKTLFIFGHTTGNIIIIKKKVLVRLNHI